MLRFWVASEFHISRCSFWVILTVYWLVYTFESLLALCKWKGTNTDILLMRSDNTQHCINIISKAPVKRANLQYTYMMIWEQAQNIICKIFKGLGIIYVITHWVILVSVSSKVIHKSTQKSILWSDIFY